MRLHRILSFLVLIREIKRVRSAVKDEEIIDPM